MYLGSEMPLSAAAFLSTFKKNIYNHNICNNSYDVLHKYHFQNILFLRNSLLLLKL